MKLYRSADFAAGAILLPALAVSLSYLILRKLATQKKIFQNIRIQEPSGKVRTLAEFNSGSRIVRNLPLAFALFSGNIRLVGVARRIPGISVPPEIEQETPGLCSMEFLRRGTRMAEADPVRVDLEYLRSRSFRKDLGILVRTLPALFFASASGNAPANLSCRLFDVRFDNLTMKEAVSSIEKRLRERQRTRVYFVNPDCFNKAWNDPEYRALLDRAEFVFPDGIGLVVAGKILRNPLRENINGTDMFPVLCENAERNGYGIYLLGAGPGVAEKMAENLRATHPNLRITGVRNGFFSSVDDENAAIRAIAQTNSDLLFVAMGVPRQEHFIDKHWKELNCTAAFGVGGLFDFVSGRIPRAPAWLRECGMEWTFRLAQEPRRMFRRYILGNPLFLFRVAAFRGKLAPWKKNKTK